MDPARRSALLESVARAFGDEIERHDGAEPVAWSTWPDVTRLIGHLGGVHRWAAAVLRTGERTSQPSDLPAPADARAWYLDGLDELLTALRGSRPDDPCWVITGTDRTAGFWWRRMVFETTKHLMDLRAAGGGTWRAAAELAPADYADGVDELVSVFLPRSRPALRPLPAPVRLVGTDTGRSWTFATDWHVGAGTMPDAAEVRARTGDLALLVWQRADPFGRPERFALRGSEDAIAAFVGAEIHP